MRLGCDNCDGSCGKIPQVEQFNKVPCPKNAPYLGQTYPYDPAIEGNVNYIIRQGSLDLMQVDGDASGSITLYKSFAEEYQESTAFLQPTALVAEALVPSGQQAVYCTVEATISDPSQVDTVWFAVFNGNDRIVNIWDGSLNKIITPHVTGGLAQGGGSGKSFSVRAIVAPNRWTTATGGNANKLRSQIQARAKIELWTTTTPSPAGRDKPC